jgi:hypothetical protein
MQLLSNRSHPFLTLLTSPDMVALAGVVSTFLMMKGRTNLFIAVLHTLSNPNSHMPQLFAQVLSSFGVRLGMFRWQPAERGDIVVVRDERTISPPPCGKFPRQSGYRTIVVIDDIDLEQTIPDMADAAEAYGGSLL